MTKRDFNGLFTSSHCLGKLAKISSRLRVFWMSWLWLWLTHSFNIREAQFKYRVLICMDKWEKWCGVSECPTSHTLSLFARKFTWTWFYLNVEGYSLNHLLADCWLSDWPSYNVTMDVVFGSVLLKRMCSPVRLSMTMSYWPTK